MTDAPAGPAASRARAWAHRLRSVVALLLLAILASRCFISEEFFQLPPINLDEAFYSANADLATDPVNRQDLAKACYATGLLLTFALWATAQVIAPRPTRGKAFLGGVILFAALSAVSATRANNPIAAWGVWWDQLGILLAGFVAWNVFDDPKQWRALILTLISVGVLLTCKGLFQHFVELPAMHDELTRNPTLLFRMTGFPPGSSQESLFLERAAQNTPTGYFSMGNILASLLLVPVFVIPGIIRGAWKDSVSPLRRSCLTLGLALAAAVIGYCIHLTASRGAIAAGAGVMLLGILVLMLPGVWRRRMRLGLIVAVILAIGIGFFAMGRQYVRTGHAPGGASMDVRWEYWSVTGDILDGHEWFGVGGGNYATHYLQHRKLGAAEAVQTPHNVAVHAITQFGWVGGVLYLTLLGGMLVAMTRSQSRETRSDDGTFSMVHTLAAVGLAITLAIGLFSGHASGDMFLVFAIPPAFGFLVVFALLAWITRRVDLSATPVRIMMTMGLMGLALHNLVSYSLWMPAAATAFWILTGAALSRFEPPKRTSGLSMRWSTLVLSAALLATCTIIYFAPALQRTRHWWTVARLLQTRDNVAACFHALPLLEGEDSRDLVEGARLCARTVESDPIMVGFAVQFAEHAVGHSPTDPDVQQLFMEMSWRFDGRTRSRDQWIALVEPPCALDPQNPERYYAAAYVLSTVDPAGRQSIPPMRLELAREYAQRGIVVDDALPEESLYRLPPEKRQRLEGLAATPVEP